MNPLSLTGRAWMQASEYLRDYEEFGWVWCIAHWQAKVDRLEARARRDRAD